MKTPWTPLAVLATAAAISLPALAQPASSSSRAPAANASPLEVPEPSTLPLVVLGVVGAVAVIRFIKRK